MLFNLIRHSFGLVSERKNSIWQFTHKLNVVIEVSQFTQKRVYLAVLLADKNARVHELEEMKADPHVWASSHLKDV
jgi:hypothetical protein